MLSEKPDDLTMLEYVGREMIIYRSFGRKLDDNHVLPWNEKANQFFADDHDLIRHFIDSNKLNTFPRRAVFGLPHNYFFSDKKQVEVTAVKSERRASPLFIHIHELANGQCVAVLTVLPARFLQNGDSLKVKVKDKKIPKGNQTYHAHRGVLSSVQRGLLDVVLALSSPHRGVLSSVQKDILVPSCAKP